MLPNDLLLFGAYLNTVDGYRKLFGVPMDKEILITLKNFEINFFYDDFDLTSDQVSLYSESLKSLVDALEWFKREVVKFETSKFVININLVNDLSIKELNREHRDKDHVTDVLSFPLQESIRANDVDIFNNAIETGDLFVCHAVCEKQAKEFQISYMEEFIHLVVHGFLHLCGYDHELNEAEEKLMEQLEEKIIKRVVLNK